MHRDSEVYRFGPFELNPAHRRLMRRREPVALSLDALPLEEAFPISRQ